MEAYGSVLRSVQSCILFIVSLLVALAALICIFMYLFVSVSLCVCPYIYSIAMYACIIVCMIACTSVRVHVCVCLYVRCVVYVHMVMDPQNIYCQAKEQVYCIYINTLLVVYISAYTLFFFIISYSCSISYWYLYVPYWLLPIPYSLFPIGAAGEMYTLYLLYVIQPKDIVYTHMCTLYIYIYIYTVYIYIYIYILFAYMYDSSVGPQCFR